MNNQLLVGLLIVCVLIFLMNGKKMKLPKQIEKYSGFIMVGVLVLLFFCMRKKRIVEGGPGDGPGDGPGEDTDGGKTDEEKLEEIESELAGDNVPEAEDYAKEIFNSNVKYQFVDASLESRAFFSVSPVGGKIIVKLNTQHAAYNQFVEVLKDDIPSDSNLDDVISRLQKAQNGLKLLLMAWARYEDETPDGKLKGNVKDARMDWGKMASEFMWTDE